MAFEPINGEYYANGSLVLACSYNRIYFKNIPNLKAGDYVDIWIDKETRDVFFYKKDLNHLNEIGGFKLSKCSQPTTLTFTNSNLFKQLQLNTEEHLQYNYENFVVNETVNKIPGYVFVFKTATKKQFKSKDELNEENDNTPSSVSSDTIASEIPTEVTNGTLPEVSAPTL